MKIGGKVYRAKVVENTMAWAKEHMLEAPDGAVFLADQIQQAQGRQDRIWSLYPGQLPVTFILKPPLLGALSPEDLPIRLNQLNMAISLGILDPLKSYGVQLKWPNDFFVDNKKLGGMIAHLVWHGQHPIGIVIGFAINVNNIFREDDPLYPFATSLKTITGIEQDIRALYKNTLAHLNAWYNAWQQEAFMDIYKTWKNSQAFLGKKITIHQKDGSLIEGTAQQVFPNGDLLLSDQNKKQKIISFYQVEEVKVS